MFDFSVHAGDQGLQSRWARLEATSRTNIHRRWARLGFWGCHQAIWDMWWGYKWFMRSHLICYCWKKMNVFWADYVHNLLQLYQASNYQVYFSYLNKLSKAYLWPPRTAAADQPVASHLLWGFSGGSCHWETIFENSHGTETDDLASLPRDEIEACQLRCIHCNGNNGHCITFSSICQRHLVLTCFLSLIFVF